MKNLPKAGFYEIALVFLGSRHKYVCEGKSMNPTLKDGGYVFLNLRAELRIGDIVLARHPFKQSVTIIKRIREISPEGKYFLVGDNATGSSDSRGFGAILAKNIIGKAVSGLK